MDETSVDETAHLNESIYVFTWSTRNLHCVYIPLRNPVDTQTHHANKDVCPRKTGAHAYSGGSPGSYM